MELGKTKKIRFKQGILSQNLQYFNRIQDGPFRGCSRMANETPFPKNCFIYPTMMKLGTFMPYLKEIRKIYESRDTSLEVC